MSTKARDERAWMQTQTQPRQSAGKKAHRQERTKQPRLNANKDHDRSDMVGYDELGIAPVEWDLWANLNANGSLPTAQV
ncbi:hypothetical protein Daesc_007568 [Daldinia eschscholtzii]|uniref:Uncharacterized protein n=1 Tax=Daldinia eschscholtzii TaxID=292717 RepID=A0AAX6MEI3_9PEZI